MKRAILTGATGMIGLSLIRYLSSMDCEIYCVVRENTGKHKLIPQTDNIHVIPCDISNLRALPDLIHSNCNAFFHLGWAGTFGDSRNDTELQQLNIKYTLDAVDAASSLRCGVFVGAGSQAEYGRVSGCLKPDTSVNPDNGYGIAKYAAGKLSAIRCNVMGIRHTWARILSVYGPYDNTNSLIMSCIHAFLKGDQISLTAGEQLWDYLYCDDAARALYQMSELGKDGSVYPLGGGTARPLRDYVTIIRNIIDPNRPLEFGKRPYADNQVMHLCADITALKNDTDYFPKVDFETGILLTIKWFKQLNI